MKLALAFAAVIVAGSLSMAADAENKATTTVDHSTNPITGTETTKKVTTKKVKGATGEAEAKVTETTKVTKDGKTTTKTEVKASAEEKKEEKKH